MKRAQNIVSDERSDVRPVCRRERGFGDAAAAAPGSLLSLQTQQGETIVQPETENSQDCQREDGRIEGTREAPVRRGRHTSWSENVTRSPKSEKSRSIIFQGNIYKD